MKIAIIGSFGYPFVYGGFETFVKELSERLIKYDDIEITVYCRKNYFKSYPNKINGINLIYLNTIKSKTLAQLIHSFRSISHALLRDFDILYVLNSGNGLFGIFSYFTKKKTIINVDGLEWQRPKWKGLGALYFLIASYFSTKLFDTVVTDSKEMQKIYKKKFNCNSFFIPYGELERNSTNSSLLDEWGLKPKRYYLIVGRLIPDNNIEYIISEFIKTNSNRDLVVVGDDLFEGKFSKQIKNKSSGRIKFLGYVNNAYKLNELFCNSYAYIHGHEFGGTNPTLLQALASKISIIALNSVFSHEILDSTEHNCFFDKKNNSLLRVLENFENRSVNCIPKFGLERIKSIYNWDKIADEYHTLFKCLYDSNN